MILQNNSLSSGILFEKYFLKCYHFLKFMLKGKIKNSIKDETLKSNLWKAVNHTLSSRKKVLENYPDWENLRDEGYEIRRKSIDNLDDLWEKAKRKIEERGGSFHFAKDYEEAKKFSEDILKKYKEYPVIKSKSMVSEEISIREYLEKKGFEIYETDLGELIVQWEGKPPSHITAPAIHLSRKEISKIFEEKLKIKTSDEPEELTKIARNFLRDKFLKAKSSIVGANFIVSENGSLVLLENEGNIRFCLQIPEEIVVITGYEKIIPNLDNLKIFLKLLPPSATGQIQNCYTSFVPLNKKFHLIVLKNFRKKIFKSDLKEILYCIRCGGCINTCPVFSLIGGHSYSSVYPGPIGLILSFFNKERKLSKNILNLCSLCLSCTEICPVKIPIHKIILKERNAIKKSLFEKLFIKILTLISKKYFFELSFNFYKLIPFFIRKIISKKWLYKREDLKIKSMDFFKLWKKKN